MYFNVKFSIWNVMRGDVYGHIVNKRNGLKFANMIRYETEMELPSSLQIIEYVDQALVVLEIVYRLHGEYIEVLVD